MPQQIPAVQIMANDSFEETPQETRWFMSAGRSGKKWATFDYLINGRMIASRIAEEIGVGRATISKHIKWLIAGAYIKEARGLMDHQQQAKQARKESVTGFCKAYIAGPNAAVLQAKIRDLKANMGVSREGAERASVVTPLPGGVEPLVDVHRLDYHLPVTKQPQEKSLAAWKTLGAEPHGKPLRGWQHWSFPSFESEIGTWKVKARRRRVKVEDENGEITGYEWGDFTSFRITGPRVYCTIEECMTPNVIEHRIGSAVWEVRKHLCKTYGFDFAIDMRMRVNQPNEAGALRYDPELAEQIKQHRRTNPEMLKLADGITADGSHDLLDEGAVHLDCEDIRQAAMQANPVATIEFMRLQMQQQTDQFEEVANSSIETIEEQSVRAAQDIRDMLTNSMQTMIEQMMNTFEVRFQEHLQQFFEHNQTRVNRAIERFEARLRGMNPEAPEGQMTLFDWRPEDDENDGLGA